MKKLSREELINKKAELKKEKEEQLKATYDILFYNADQRLKNHLTQAREKGASSWLTALPLKSLNYTLNKQEFQFNFDMAGLLKECQVSVHVERRIVFTMH